MLRSIHPFPARMAPELALQALSNLQPGSLVLDPMTGSGTVAREALILGHSVRAFDLDPLAVLISKVSTTFVRAAEVVSAGNEVLAFSRTISLRDIRLPWIDSDSDAKNFVAYWFGPSQIKQLRRLSFALHSASALQLPEDVVDVLRIALSRIIITKQQTASLAQDTSHSRPHRVATESGYDIFSGFEKSILSLVKRLPEERLKTKARVRIGDARRMTYVRNESVDAIITSPPYLNAIDYLRGHRLSLIWLGHGLKDISKARSNSIGSERKPENPRQFAGYELARRQMGNIEALPNRFQGIVDRFISDMSAVLKECNRVLKGGSTATFVVGNSCLRGVYISNSGAISACALKLGFDEVSRRERELPGQHRYLPPPKSGPLGKRMRTEVVLTFRKIAISTPTRSSQAASSSRRAQSR